jgi:hypothetical protein
MTSDYSKDYFVDLLLGAAVYEAPPQKCASIEFFGAYRRFPN